MPPASRRPTIWRSCVVRPANTMRRAVAAADADQDGLVALLLGQAAAMQPMTIALSPREDEVDHHHLQEGGQDVGRKDLGHGRLVQVVEGGAWQSDGVRSSQAVGTASPEGRPVERLKATAFVPVRHQLPGSRRRPGLAARPSGRPEAADQAGRSGSK